MPGHRIRLDISSSNHARFDVIPTRASRSRGTAAASSPTIPCSTRAGARPGSSWPSLPRPPP